MEMAERKKYTVTRVLALKNMLSEKLVIEKGKEKQK